MLTFSNTPNRFSPAGTPVIFKLSGASSNSIYFSVDLIEEKTQGTIYSGKIYPTPLNPTQASINLSKVLASLVSPELDNSNELIQGKSDPIIGFKLRASEYTASTTGQLLASDTGVTTSYFYAYNAYPDTLRFSYDTNPYVITSGSRANFLTYIPNNKAVNEFSNEQLWVIQSGFTALTLSVTSSTGTYSFGISGTTNNPYIQTPAIPETRAFATLTFTGVSLNQGDNIGVSAGTRSLGAYTAATSGVSAINLALGLEASLGANIHGYGISRSGATLTIQAPVGSGASANGLALNTALTNLSTSYSASTGGTSASVLVLGYSFPVFGDTTTITVSDSTYGNIELASYDRVDANIADFTTSLVSAINANPYGYTASVGGSARFTITARAGTGADMNGQPLVLENSSDYLTYEFYSGSTSGYSAFTVNHVILPHTKTNFSGGVTSSPAVTGYTLSKMLRIRTSPSSLALSGVTGLSAGTSYSVCLQTGTTQLTEVRKYKVLDTDCNVDYMNVIFTNSVGGVDSIQFLNPIESYKMDKMIAKKNHTNLDTPNPFMSNGLHNTQYETYDTNTKGTIKAYTPSLTDDYNKVLMELLVSRDVYLELNNGDLVPVQVKTTAQDIKKKKFLTNDIVQYQVEFELPDNYLPVSGDVNFIINS